MNDQELIQKAVEAAKLAYAPYSKFHVGAAILTSAGRIFTGCNVENASYGLTNCAERVAVGSAVAAGERDFSAIAISVKNGGSPCGACRQVLYEFNPKMRVLMADENGDLVKDCVLEYLLPDGFGPKNLSE